MSTVLSIKHKFFFIVFLPPILAWKNFTENLDLRRFNLNELLQNMPISEQCRNAISDNERICFGHHLMRYEGFEVQDNSDRSVLFTGDTSAEFDRRVCCEIWRWFDCTGSAIAATKDQSDGVCTYQDYANWWAWPDTDNQIVHYCSAFEYGTYRCWYISLFWTIIIALTVFALVSAMVIYCICNCKSVRYERPPPNPQPVPTKEIRYNFPV